MSENEASGSPDTVETPLSQESRPSSPADGAGTVHRMSALKAGLISAAIGLAIAAGVFAGLGLPGTLKAAQSDSRYAVTAAVGEMIHVGLGPFHPSGPREIRIVSLALENPSPAVQLDSVRITRFTDAGTVLLGSYTGPRDDINNLAPALGAVLEPGQDGGFWLTFHVTSTGRHSLDGLRVTYRSGWLSRTTVVGPDVRVKTGDQRREVEQLRDRRGRDRSRKSPAPSPS